MSETSGRRAARDALAGGLARLAEHPLATGLAMLGGAMGALALAAGETGARAVLHEGGLSHVGTAMVLWTIGGTVAALSYAVALAGVLGGARIHGAFRRATGMISLIAIERLIQFSLLIAIVFPFLRWASAHPRAGAFQRAVALTAALAPTIPIGLLTAGAFAIAVARTATGIANWRALLDGIEFALRHLGLLLRTVALTLAVTAPLWLPPLAFAGHIAAAQHPLEALVATALGGALVTLSALWGYAALACLVDGADDVAGELGAKR